jgi:hypothetical protein
MTMGHFTLDLRKICCLADVYSVFGTDQQHEEYSFIDDTSSLNHFSYRIEAFRQSFLFRSSSLFLPNSHFRFVLVLQNAIIFVLIIVLVTNITLYETLSFQHQY